MQVNTQGQITIPLDIQDQLGLLPGTEVQLEVVGDTLQLRKTSVPSRGRLLVDSIQGKATTQLSTDEIMQLTRDS